MRTKFIGVLIWHLNMKDIFAIMSSISQLYFITIPRTSRLFTWDKTLMEKLWLLSILRPKRRKTGDLRGKNWGVETCQGRLLVVLGFEKTRHCSSWRFRTWIWKIGNDDNRNLEHQRYCWFPSYPWKRWILRMIYIMPKNLLIIILLV